MQLKQSNSAVKVCVVMLAMFLLAASVATQSAQAKTRFKVLHTFHGSDGFGPVGVIFRDVDGNLYGTASGGGAGSCGGDTCGTAFKLDKSGKKVWLRSFLGKNGMGPEAGLLSDGTGNYYGTTIEGGDLKCADDPLGCGTVFKLDQTGREILLYKFKGKPDGWAANSPLVKDAAGNLYGTTENGGSSDFGTVFKLEPNGKETVLHNFTGGSDGCLPIGVILDAADNLYGVASQGGSGFCDTGDGVVFKLDASENFSILHTFGGSDGALPASVLLLDSDENLYGTTTAGGNSTACFNGCGTVFELLSNGTETVLYSFCSLSNCADGESPMYGPLVRDSEGSLYGTADQGGLDNDGCNGGSCGVVFKLDTNRKETVLHNFTGRTDGGVPVAGLVMDTSGNLYGTTLQGGDTQCNPSYGCGVIFRVNH